MTGPVLAFDSSTGVGSAAVGSEGRLLAEAVFNLGAGHSSALLPAIDYVMRTAGLTPVDLEGAVVGGGPGSFTGLRIGAATAKGIVHAREIPLWAYSGLLAAAASAASSGLVCALFDARRRDVYAACYHFGEERVEELLAPVALPLAELLERFRGDDVPLFTGEAALLHREEIERELAARVAPPHLAIPRASALLWLQQVAPELGRVEDPVAWEPQYVRAAGAERIAAARAPTQNEA